MKKPEDYIWTDPNRMSGKPCIIGTRFPVSQFFAELAASSVVEDIAMDFDIDVKVLRGLVEALARKYESP